MCLNTFAKKWVLYRITLHQRDLTLNANSTTSSLPARENGGYFFHANTWAIMALALLGRNEDAYRCYTLSLPTRRNDIADVCMTEPYVYSQTMLAPPHNRAGACVNSWLTGTASWMYVTATQYILGVRPELGGLVIDPQIPEEWDGYTMGRLCAEQCAALRWKKPPKLNCLLTAKE